MLKQFGILALLALWLWAPAPSSLQAQNIVRPITPQQLQTLLANPTDTALVVNFWATWCKPCVAELPYFEQLWQQYHTQKLRVILVSLDEPEGLKKIVQPFVTRRNLHPEVFVMTEINPNKWIDAVETGWSGALPVSLFYTPGGKKMHFQNGEIDYTTLEKLTRKLLDLPANP
jgi:thiol-disulfide isomerase/thioredoxin